MNAEFVAMAQGLELPGGVHAHIAGIDLVRVGEKDFYVLEDNVRTPSGVSYVLENREVMMRLAPELFSAMRVLPVADYSEELLATLRSVSFSDDAEPNVVLLTPGHYNSAYFEHAFLADEMGIELVEGSDLFVDEGRVYMRTPRGPAARRRDLSPGRRCLPRSAGDAAGLRCSACRAARARCAPAGSTSSTRWATAWPTTSRPTPTCPR